MMNSAIPISVFVYLSGSIGSSLVKQATYYTGLSDDTLLLSMVTAFAYIISGSDFFSVFSSKVDADKVPKYKSSSSFHILFLYSILAISGGILVNQGLSRCGSGIHQVLYSSMTLFTSLFSFLFTGKRPTMRELFGLCLITIGMSISVIPFLPFNQIHSILSDSEGTVVLGMLLSLAGTFAFALCYVVDEYLMKHVNDYGLTGKDISYRTGIIQFILLLALHFLLVTPNLPDYLIRISNFQLVFWLLALQFLCDFCNAQGYYGMIESIGATGAGVCQGLVSSGVFILRDRKSVV